MPPYETDIIFLNSSNKPNLILSCQIWSTCIWGPRSDSYLISGYAPAVRRFRLEFMWFNIQKFQWQWNILWFWFSLRNISSPEIVLHERIMPGHTRTTLTSHTDTYPFTLFCLTVLRSCTHKCPHTHFQTHANIKQIAQYLTWTGLIWAYFLSACHMISTFTLT